MVGVTINKREFKNQLSGTYHMILAAIPAYNEEVAIGTVVLRTKKYVDKVLVIDDGSSDATAQIAELAGAEVIRHPKNMGKGVAIKDGFMKAREYGADILVCIDSDGQHNPDEIPGLIAPIRNGQADMVIGSRFLGDKNSVPGYRRVGQEILNSLTNSISHTKVTDSQSGFRAYSKKAIATLSLTEEGIGIESNLLRYADDLNLKIMEVPISCRYDVEHASKMNPVHHGFSVINSILKIVEERRPLLFFGLSGTVLVCIGLILGLWVVNVYSITKQFAIGTSLIAILAVMVGVISIFNGIMLHAISKIIKK
jgi:glycosyltransferase involved in cell wall biosynthesis